MVGIQYTFFDVLAAHVTVVLELQKIVLNMNDKKVALIGTHPQADDRRDKENQD